LRRARAVKVSSDLSVQALKGDKQGPVWRRKLWMWSAMNLARWDGAHAPPPDRHVFGGRVDNAICAELHRVLQQRASRTLSTTRSRPPYAHDLGDAAISTKLRRRIGQRFENAVLVFT
jgi:hypothetical protein